MKIFKVDKDNQTWVINRLRQSVIDQMLVSETINDYHTTGDACRHTSLIIMEVSDVLDALNVQQWKSLEYKSKNFINLEICDLWCYVINHIVYMRNIFYRDSCVFSNEEFLDIIKIWQHNNHKVCTEVAVNRFLKEILISKNKSFFHLETLNVIRIFKDICLSRNISLIEVLLRHKHRCKYTIKNIANKDKLPIETIPPKQIMPMLRENLCISKI